MYRVMVTLGTTVYNTDVLSALSEIVGRYS